MAKGHGRSSANNRSNQMNPNNAAYWSSRGVPTPTLPVAPGPAPDVPPPPAIEPTSKK